jgi:hypothetical protein
MTAARLLLLSFITGFPVVALLFRWWMGRANRAQRVAALRAEAVERTLLLPGVSAEISGQDEVAVYLHNGHDRSICFHALADLLVVSLRSAGLNEKMDVDVVEAFFPKSGFQAWLEAGATAGPFYLKKDGLQRLEVSYRHVEANSTVETSRKVITV